MIMGKDYLTPVFSGRQAKKHLLLGPMQSSPQSQQQAESDEQLLARFLESGDQELLGMLYNRYMELVYGLCLKYFKDEGLAQDAVMDIYEHLLRKVPRHSINQFRPWLYVLAKNHCLGILRKQSAKITDIEETPLMQSLVDLHPVEDGEPERVEAEEQQLRNCIETLSDEQRYCVQQFFYGNKSYKEIAAEMNWEVGKVRSYLQNGKRNLKNCMNAKMAKEKDR